jgi:hypothetical protein
VIVYAAAQSAQQVVNYLQGQIYEWAAVAVALGIAFAAVTLTWVWKNNNRTKAGKILDSVKGKPKQLLIAQSKGTYAKLLPATDFNPEGVLETLKFKNRAKGAKGQRRKTYFPPRKFNVGSATDIMPTIDYPESTEDAKKLEVAETTRQMLQNMIDKTSEKLFLEGVGPISVVVEDKTIVANIPGLGVMEFYKKLEAITKIGPKIQALLSTVDFHDVGVALEYLFDKVSVIPFDMIREYFDESYDQSNAEAQNEWYHMQGFREGVASVKQDRKENDKMWMYMGIIGIAGGCCIAGIGLFLGK